MARPSLKTEAPAADDRALPIKWRPQQFDGVIGQDAAVKSLRSVLKKSTPHTFLMSGPSGTGKTTLARILALELGIAKGNVLEIDAAKFSSVEMVRTLLEQISYRPILKEGRAAWFVIVDECHGLSKAAWQAMLKDSEEPPDYVYFAFATTELTKVPQTIITRCHHVSLSAVKRTMLSEYLEYVCEEEGLEKLIKSGVVDIIAGKAQGSVRQALQYLSAARDCEDRQEALELMELAHEKKEAVDFARWITSGQGFTWKEGMKLLEALEEADVAPEGVRLVVINFVASMLKNKKDDKGVPKLLSILDAFSGITFHASEKMAPVILALGKVMYGQD